MTTPLSRGATHRPRTALALDRPDWAAFSAPSGWCGEPEALLCALWRDRGRFGVTRLSMLTGLDAIGLPVAQATRPFGLGNTVAQGRGTNPVVAQVGAMMEAAELAAAETTAWQNVTVARAAALDGTDAFVPAVALADRDGWATRPRAWTTARDLVRGGEALVPVALVEADYGLPDRHPDHAFARATTGLGAGPNADHALRHALLELIEREAVDRARNGALPAVPLDLGTGAAWRDRPGTRPLTQLLAAVRNAGARVSGRLIGPLRAGSSTIHVVEMWVAGNGARRGSRPARPAAEGTAASPSAVRAALSALGEAVQARASLAAGTRDDLTRDLYEGRVRSAPPEGTSDPTLHPMPDPDAPPAVPGTAALVEHCLALGGRAVHAVPLLADPVRVVRVVAPPLAIRLGRAGG